MALSICYFFASLHLHVYPHPTMPSSQSTARPRSAIAIPGMGKMNERGGGLCVDAKPSFEGNLRIDASIIQ